MTVNYDDFHRVACTTKIKEIRDGWYLFEDTVFYGEKGGMPDDKGTINGLPVTAMKWDGDELLHQVDGTLQNPVEMAVDWPLRLLNTAVQTGLHCLDSYYEQTGQRIIAFSVNPENQWYETDGPAADLSDVQRYIDDVIAADHPVRFTYVKGADYPDPAYRKYEQVRLVEIADVNTQPCGTLHVSRTCEIGSFVLLGSEKTSRGTKVFFTCGPVTAMRLKEYHRIMEEVGRTLSAKGEEMIETAVHLQTLNRTMKKEIEGLRKETAALKAEALKTRPETVIETAAGDLNELRSIAQVIMNGVSGTKVLYCPQETETLFALISSENKARVLLDGLKQHFAVTGGGSPKMAAAKASADAEAFLAVLSRLLEEQ